MSDEDYGQARLNLTLNLWLSNQDWFQTLAPQDQENYRQAISQDLKSYDIDPADQEVSLFAYLHQRGMAVRDQYLVSQDSKEGELERMVKELQEQLKVTKDNLILAKYEIEAQNTLIDNLKRTQQLPSSKPPIMEKTPTFEYKVPETMTVMVNNEPRNLKLIEWIGGVMEGDAYLYHDENQHPPERYVTKIWFNPGEKGTERGPTIHQELKARGIIAQDKDFPINFPKKETMQYKIGYSINRFLSGPAAAVIVSEAAKELGYEDNFVPILDWGTVSPQGNYASQEFQGDSSVSCLIMPYCEGLKGALRKLPPESDKITEADRLLLQSQMADIVAGLEAKGILACDIQADLLDGKLMISDTSVYTILPTSDYLFRFAHVAEKMYGIDYSVFDKLSRRLGVLKETARQRAQEEYYIYRFFWEVVRDKQKNRNKDWGISLPIGVDLDAGQLQEAEVAETRKKLRDLPPIDSLTVNFAETSHVLRPESRIGGNAEGNLYLCLDEANNKWVLKIWNADQLKNAGKKTSYHLLELFASGEGVNIQEDGKVTINEDELGLSYSGQDEGSIVADLFRGPAITILINEILTNNGYADLILPINAWGSCEQTNISQKYNYQLLPRPYIIMPFRDFTPDFLLTPGEHSKEQNRIKKAITMLMNLGIIPVDAEIGTDRNTKQSFIYDTSVAIVDPDIISDSHARRLAQIQSELWYVPVNKTLRALKSYKTKSSSPGDYSDKFREYLKRSRQAIIDNWHI